MIHEFVCIVCPRGCRLRVDSSKDYEVTGNACPRGIPYGKQEAKAPMRTVTTSMKILGSDEIRCPVKTSEPIPKELMQDVVNAAKQITLHAPIHIGDVVLENVVGTGANLLSTRSLPSRDETA